MENKATDIMVNAMNLNGDTLTILQGRAEEPREFKTKIALSGNLDSPLRFIQNRMETIPPMHTHVVANREKGTITLVINESDKHSTTVLGKLVETEYIKKLNINENKQYSLKDLAQLLKTNVMHFADTTLETGESICMVIVSSLRNFQAKINTEIVDKTGDRGELTKMFDRKMENHNIPESFILKMPIFKGLKEVEFKVDICFQVRDAAVYAWLESNELRKLTVAMADAAIDEQLTNDFFEPFVIIEE